MYQSLSVNISKMPIFLLTGKMRFSQIHKILIKKSVEINLSINKVTRGMLIANFPGHDSGSDALIQLFLFGYRYVYLHSQVPQYLMQNTMVSFMSVCLSADVLSLLLDF